MTDINSISGVLSSISTTTEIAKLIYNSNTSLEKSEQKMKLAELIGSLANTKIQMADVQQEIINKDKRISQLEEKLKVQESLEWESPYYWITKGTSKDGPYCQQCYDSNKNLIRLQGNGEGYWECMTCQNGFFDKSYSASLPQVVRSEYNPLFDDQW
jgi:hypothetical protein